MSVGITFYNFSKRVNETLQPSGGTTIQCVLKEPTDFESPSFIITGNHFEYTYAKWGVHYYFVTGVKSLGANRCEVSLDLDPMATYKTQIGNTSAYILRAAGDHDGQIIDTLFPTTTEITYQGVDIASIFTAPRLLTTSQTIVLSVANKDLGNVNKMFGMTHYAMAPGTFALLQEKLYADTDFLGIFKSSENPLQYVSGARIYPFAVGNGAQTEPVILGEWTAPDMLSNSIESNRATFSTFCAVPSHPQAAALPWANHSPYSKFTLFFPPFGDIPIDADLVMNSPNRHLTFDVDVDLLSGQGVLSIYLNATLIARYRSTIGVDVPLSQITKQSVGDIVSAVTGTVASAAMAASGNVIGGVSSEVITIGNAIESAMPKYSRVGTFGTLADYERPPRLLCEFVDIVPPDNTHFGRPLCQTRKINTLSGFIKCSNASVSISGTQRSRERINAMLNSGFYYT